MAPSSTLVAVSMKMTEGEKKQLRELAKEAGLNMSQVVRQMIRARHSMVWRSQASCVDGNLCLCPQLHIRPRQEPS